MNDHPAGHVPGTDVRGAAKNGGAVLANLTPLAQQYLDETRPWVRFMSVITFVSAGLMVVLGLVMLVISIFGGLAAGNRGGLGPLGGVVGGALMALVYLALACVYIAPGLYLARYAGAIRRLKATPTSGGLEDTLKHQKSFWRFVGIMTAIGLAIAVVVVGLAIVAVVIGASIARRS